MYNSNKNDQIFAFTRQRNYAIHGFLSEIFTFSLSLYNYIPNYLKYVLFKRHKENSKVDQNSEKNIVKPSFNLSRVSLSDLYYNFIDRMGVLYAYTVRSTCLVWEQFYSCFKYIVTHTEHHDIPKINYGILCYWSF